jgi:4-hydroxybenzoate polyprenyltransferase
MVLYLLALLFSSDVSRRFEWFVLVYMFVSLSYTLFFKDMVIIDVFIISFGFLVRVLAGGEAFRVPVTKWLFLTVFMVSLLLAAGKRLGELISLGADAHSHRRSLGSYSPSFLEGMLWFSAAVAMVTYALYTFEHASASFYTVPLAAFGLLRYIYIVKQGNGDPTEALIKDGQILATGMVWILVNGALIYHQ